MAYILGIVGSARRWGNSDLLVRQALLGAQAEGAVVKAVRLTDLSLSPCTGCMRCVAGEPRCPLDDDLAWLVDIIQAARGLVLAAPTYFLGPAATVKLVLDRLLVVMGQVNQPLPPTRPAVTIATAGLESWRGVALPFLNAVAGVFGYRAIDSLTALAPGPGEVLLDEELMARVLAAGQRLGRGELEPAPAPPNVCPICRCDCFVLNGAQATCPICGREAAIEHDGRQVTLRFDAPRGIHQRWTPEGLRAHVVEWVMATAPRYQARRGEIKARRAAYRDREVEWLHPRPLGERS
ncbi:MAG: flavodoxin family protein [Anaerolineae bacterium]|nr:flavodoxin family protein [Anaerolineae bacterium]